MPPPSLADLKQSLTSGEDAGSHVGVLSLAELRAQLTTHSGVADLDGVVGPEYLVFDISRMKSINILYPMVFCMKTLFWH